MEDAQNWMDHSRQHSRQTCIRIHRVGTATDAVFRATEALSLADDNDALVVIRNTDGNLLTTTNLGSSVDRIGLLVTQLMYEFAGIVKSTLAEPD